MLADVQYPAKAIIAGRGLKIRAVAAEVGVNPHTFGRILNGQTEAWPALRRRLAQYLEVDEAELFR